MTRRSSGPRSHKYVDGTEDGLIPAIPPKRQGAEGLAFMPLSKSPDRGNEEGNSVPGVYPRTGLSVAAEGMKMVNTVPVG
jgi:hypothetical protein